MTLPVVAWNTSTLMPVFLLEAGGQLLDEAAWARGVNGQRLGLAGGQSERKRHKERGK
ncbi:hypothetical protein [Achromobacter xylosoxidans]|uniref:hypothetical protein n=1 Tax=Alcaligenes xylosoxydans xylosoxydans TaxID=85698 RepID=UPI002D7FB4CC|nr:hypothetical protein [Achromobacter xylosoxidans]